LLELPQWTKHQRDDAAQEAIRADIRRVLATSDRDDWVERLAGNDTCVAPVREITELPALGQHAARRAFTDAEHPTHGRFRQLAPVLAGSDRSTSTQRVPDTTVTDTDRLLGAAGVPAAEIAELKREGIVA
jgi:alpha-methylacyl-CoA racemase